jgi:hypothetical protein
VRVLPLLPLISSTSPAVELHLQFGALERMLSQTVFTQEGRKYFRGSKESKCNFAYLEHAQIKGEGGRLRIRARFTGRSSLNMFGQCVGLGDAFDVIVTARPVFHDGQIALRDVTATGDNKTGFFIRRVCAAMAASLGHDFHYPLAAEARKALEETGAQPDYKRELRNFQVSEIRVTDDALVLAIDFQLTVQ